MFKILLYMALSPALAYDIFQYYAPIVTVRDGYGWIADGYFHLVHMINLEQYELTASILADAMNETRKDEVIGGIFDYQLDQVTNRIGELKGQNRRERRSINWIGSAWKWLAGSPDAADWDELLRSQNDVIENNNQQYKINSQLFNLTHTLLIKVNQIALASNEIANSKTAENIQRSILLKLLILKEEISELVRACQMAKAGIVNSNLINNEEVNQILSEVEVLPYQNVIEAIEYGRPSIFSNGTTLLYVLSMPKVRKNPYNLLLTRASIIEGRRVKLPFLKLLVSEAETYGLKGACQQLENAMVCRDDAIEAIPEKECLPRLLKGGEAPCIYERSMEVNLELIKEDTIFLSNFKGTLASLNSTKELNGTYIIQLRNETVRLNNRTFTASTSTGVQALPPVLSSIKHKGMEINLELIHDMATRNIRYLSSLRLKTNLHLAAGSITTAAVAVGLWLLWRRLTRTRNLPDIDVSILQLEPPMNHPVSGPQTPRRSPRDADLRDADF